MRVPLLMLCLFVGWVTALGQDFYDSELDAREASYSHQWAGDETASDPEPVEDDNNKNLLVNPGTGWVWEAVELADDEAPR